MGSQSLPAKTIAMFNEATLILRGVNILFLRARRRVAFGNELCLRSTKDRKYGTEDGERPMEESVCRHAKMR
jgi:hypothetical protein